MAFVPEVVFVLGPPGAGKGTQCSKIVETFGYIHLSAGDLLRAERVSGSPDGDLIQDYITNGKIVPIEITIRLLEKAIFSQSIAKVLIDGFPRNKENLDGWEKAMVETGKTRTKFMLFYECSEEECFKRAMGRNQNRADDNADSFKKRISTYLESTMAVVNEFEGRGLLRRINANDTPEGVFENTQKVFLAEGDAPTLREVPVARDSSLGGYHGNSGDGITSSDAANNALTKSVASDEDVEPTVAGFVQVPELSSLVGQMNTVTPPQLPLPSPSADTGAPNEREVTQSAVQTTSAEGPPTVVQDTPVASETPPPSAVETTPVASETPPTTLNINSSPLSPPPHLVTSQQPSSDNVVLTLGCDDSIGSNDDNDAIAHGNGGFFSLCVVL